MDLIIFGAQGIALGLYKAIHSCCPNRSIRCFLVSEKGINAPVLAGIPVLEINSFADSLSQKEKDNIEILIAAPEDVMEEIEKLLESYGLHYFTRIDSLRWAELMGYYYMKDRSFLSLSALPVGCYKAAIMVYMAKFYKDRPLSSNYKIPDWTIPMQVGAALCEERVADVLDCNGEGISEKNVNYCELTGLYWIWKNRLCKEKESDISQYYGLVQYRRILNLNEDDLLRLNNNDVDVVLPYPMPYEPDIEEHHKRYLNDKDWRAMLMALEELQPEYARYFSQVLKQQYLYNYNIILARKDVLLDYCNWLFPILERTEQISIPKGNERADRYIGYIGETLSTLYFMYNRKKLNIVHTGCRFLT